MMTFRSFHIMALLCNWALASSAFFMPEEDSRLEFDAAPKRLKDIIDDYNESMRKDSNIKYKCYTSDCILRYSRSLSNPNGIPSDNEGNSNVSRHPRWKPSDVVIRFGRSNIKPTDRTSKDVNFIRFGRRRRVPTNLLLNPDFPDVCSSTELSSIISSMKKDLHPDLLELYRICTNRPSFSVDSLNGHNDLIGWYRSE